MPTFICKFRYMHKHSHIFPSNFIKYKQKPSIFYLILSIINGTQLQVLIIKSVKNNLNLFFKYKRNLYLCCNELKQRMIIKIKIKISRGYLTNFGCLYSRGMERQQVEGYGSRDIIRQGNKQLLVEGKAKIYTKYIEKNQNNQLVENEVFYNPVQIFNRDFTILVMQAYINLLKEQKKEQFGGVCIVDALSASGLRTIRFLKELQGIKIVYANDLSPASHKLMKDNFDLNQLDPTKYKQTLEDANLMLINRKKDMQFDIIDLDPYGSVVPFLDASVQGIKDGGLMCITCTDTKVTAGPDISKCYYYYGTTRAKVHHFNENALRVVLSTISSAASRHCKYIQPMISFQTDFYLRVFVRVYKGKKQCSESGTKIGNVYNCNSCGNYEYSAFLQHKKDSHFTPKRQIISSSVCTVCQQPYYLSNYLFLLYEDGPIWLDKINNLDFARRLIAMMQDKDFNMELKTHKKVYGTLVSMVQQGQLSKVPLGFNFSKMCKTIRSTCPNRATLLSGIQSLKNGFRVVPSYVSPGYYKTNAPIRAVYDFIKSWKIRDMGQEKYISPAIKQQFSIRILKKPVQFIPDFEFKSEIKLKKVPTFIKMGKNLGPKGKPMSRVIQQQNAEQQISPAVQQQNAKQKMSLVIQQQNAEQQK